MKSFYIVFKISLIKMLKSQWTYIALIAVCLAAIAAFVGVPFWYKPTDITAYFNNAWVIKSLQIMFVAWCVVGGVIGETNSTSEEKSFLLSKNINRQMFILVKIVSSILISLIICLISLLILIAMAVYVYKADKLNIFTDLGKSVNPYSIFTSFLVIVLFSSTMSTIWKYNFRHGIVLISITSLIFLYAILYNMFLPTLNPSKSTERLIWTFVPAVALPPITIVLGIFGWKMFKKLQVEI